MEFEADAERSGLGGAPATVTDMRGQKYDAMVCELMPNSLLLKALPFDLTFRDRITVELLGYLVLGEVVFSSDREAAVVFETTPEIFEAIEVFEDFVHTTTGSLDVEAPELTSTLDLEAAQGPWEALPIIDELGRITTRNDLDRLSMLLSLKAGRPLVARAEHGVGLARIEGVDSLELAAVPMGEGYALVPPGDPAALDAAIQQFRSALDESSPVLPVTIAATGPDPDDLPILKSDGTVQFRSHDQFLGQHKLNLGNGAVMARGAHQELGTKRRLVLSIPKADPLEINNAEVVFTEDGKVGFSVPEPDAFRGALEHRLTPSLDARPRSSPPRRISSGLKPSGRGFTYESALTDLPGAGAIMALRAGPPEKLGDAGGWYIGVIDRVLRSRRDALCTVRSEGEQLKIWIHDGKVVALERQPPADRDRLGERLVAARVLDNATLNRALEVARQAGRPVGQVILAKGTVTRAAVHRALRKQIMDRALVACDWSRGRIEVGAWAEPPFDADLLPVSGDAVVTALLRKQLQQTRLAELREELTAQMNRSATVDLAKISESFRLTDREHRFYGRGADTSGTLASLLSLVNTRPLEGYRLILLGAALGFISVGKR